MRRADCPRCVRGDKCRLRQPGTWVVECDAFELTAAARIGRQRDLLADLPDRLTKTGAKYVGTTTTAS